MSTKKSGRKTIAFAPPASGSDDQYADETTPLQYKDPPPPAAREENVSGRAKVESQTSYLSEATDYHDDDDDDDEVVGIEYEVPTEEELFYQRLKPTERSEMLMADRLSVRLLAAQDDSDEEVQILEETLKLSEPASIHPKDYLGGSSFPSLDLLRSTQFRSLQNLVLEEQQQRSASFAALSMRKSGQFRSMIDLAVEEQQQQQRASSFPSLNIRRSSAFRSMLDLALEERQRAKTKLHYMGMLAIFLILSIVVALIYSARAVIVTHPPLQPVGPYRLIERQEGPTLFDAYTFYVGKDSVGSNGYNVYIDKASAEQTGVINVTLEPQNQNLFINRRLVQTTTEPNPNNNNSSISEPFVYIGSSPSAAGPRNSIRLEGNRRFDRGLFILDVRHMPAGCGVWPAFWLVDEPNWPINGEIDIVEGVNYQTEAKTALHSTRVCTMDDIPLGTMTGTWDTAQGIPDKKTGIPDMTLRYAQNCFVYDPHQWLNQGCVAVDRAGGTIGVPLNRNGGGVYVLEWDPINRHIRSWVFTPHSSTPENLAQAIQTASKENPEERVMPDPDEWPLPYAYFAIGKGTNCDLDHFRHMHLVINTAFCGSVAGNRYFIDCTADQISEFPTCRDYIRSNPLEIQQEAYWKIRGIYVYEREWERTWIT